METEVWARRGASSDKLNRPFCFCLSGRAEVSPWFCATSASLVQMFWTPQCISSIIKPQGSGRMIRLRGKHSCTLHAGHQNPTALLVMNKLSCRCRHGAGPTYSCGRRITLVCRGPSQCGCSHRQQRRWPFPQVPSQRSVWKQSLRQRPWLLLHCWLSDRPLAAGER